MDKKIIMESATIIVRIATQALDPKDTGSLVKNAVAVAAAADKTAKQKTINLLKTATVVYNMHPEKIGKDAIDYVNAMNAMMIELMRE